MAARYRESDVDEDDDQQSAVQSAINKAMQVIRMRKPNASGACINRPKESLKRWGGGKERENQND